MATLLHTTSAPETEPQGTDARERTTGPLVVATDTTTASDSAMRMARAISARTRRDVIVLSIQVPAPMAAPEMQVAIPPEIEAKQREALRLHVRAQLWRTGITDEWPIEVRSGDPPAQIVRFAMEHDASLVIMGLGEHGLFDRLLGDETVLRVLRLGTVPVLAVAPGFEDLPRRVLASTDFTPSSVRAATLAADILKPHGVLTLAHVLGDGAEPRPQQFPNTAFTGAVGRAFDLMIERLGSAAPENLEREVVTGDPGKALIALAERTRADLIAAGSHGHGFLTRLRLGSVSQTLVRSARCSVLVAPPVAGPSFLDEVPAATTRFASYEWSERLEEFTRRNAGRIATLEVVDPELGAQIEEKGFPFVGAAFDSRDAQVQIMVGDFGGDGRHLTRSIAGVTAVQVLRDRAGQDILLRVAHGRGQTLLTLER